jgi:hypothetical protein
MEAPEVPTEHLHEEMEHHAHSGPRWIMGVALSSALLAALAAVASLQAGHHESEAMLAQIEAANQWSFFQAKSIKESQLKSKLDIFAALEKRVAEADTKKAEEYALEKEELQKEAKAKTVESRHELKAHQLFAKSVTFFQIAIAMGAIAALTKKKPFWLVSLGIGAGGVFYLVRAFQHTHGG